MHVHDFVAVGIGPFNLGLACLAEPLDTRRDLPRGTDRVRLAPRHDARRRHVAGAVPGRPGDDGRPHLALQLPELPQGHRAAVLLLHPRGLLPVRREYNDYCRWAAERLSSLRFGQYVDRIEHDGDLLRGPHEQSEVFRGAPDRARRRHQPGRPARAAGGGLDGTRPETESLHTADYLEHRETLRRLASVTVVGSGQSAAEVYADLLDSLAPGQSLNWVTRSPRFFPMEYTKLTLEMTSPEYTAYFQALPEATRDDLLREQKSLYKGISSDLVDQIFDRSTRSGSPVVWTRRWSPAPSWSARRSDGSSYVLELHHHESDQDFALRTDGLVLATGYAAEVPGSSTRSATGSGGTSGTVRGVPTFAVDLQGSRDLRAERRGAHPRFRRPRPRDGRTPQRDPDRRDART